MPVDRPATRFLPPLPFLAAIGVGWGLDRSLLALPLPLGAARWPLAAAAIAAGLALMLWAALTLWRHRTTVNPFGRVATLCRAGPFAFSRNPIYLGDWLILLGGACAVQSGWPLALSPLVWLAIRHGVIRHEEAHLAARFGDDYRDYCRRVRRWL